MKQLRKKLAFLLAMLLLVSVFAISAAAEGLIVTDTEGIPVEQSESTYEIAGGVIAVHANDLVFSGSTSLIISIDDGVSVSFKDFTINTDGDYAVTGSNLSITFLGTSEIWAAEAAIRGDIVYLFGNFDKTEASVVQIVAPVAVNCQELMAIAVNMKCDCNSAAITAPEVVMGTTTVEFNTPVGISCEYFGASDAFLYGDNASDTAVESTTLSIVEIPDEAVVLRTNCKLIGAFEDDDSVVLTNGSHSENAYIPDDGEEMILSMLPRLRLFKAMDDESWEDIENPVSGIPMEEVWFYDYFVINHEPFETYEIEWLCDVPTGLTLTPVDGCIYLTTTEDTPAGEYPFILTNGLQETDPEYLFAEETLIIEENKEAKPIEIPCTSAYVVGTEEDGWHAVLANYESNIHVALYSPEEEIPYGQDCSGQFDLSESKLVDNENEIGIVSVVYNRTPDRENGKMRTRAEILCENGSTYIFTGETVLLNADDMHITIIAPQDGMVIEDWSEQIVVQPEKYDVMASVGLTEDENLDFEECFEAGKTYYLSFLPFGMGTENFEFDPEDDYSGMVTLKDGTVCEAVGNPFAIGFLTPMVKYTIPAKSGYEISDGANAKWTQKSGKDLTFRSSAPFDKFESVMIDGKTVAPENYTVKEGSTVVTLKDAYLDTLSVGKHTLTVVSSDGSAETEFTVTAAHNNNGKNDSPATGDTSDIALWSVLLLVSAAALTVVKKSKT